MKTGKQVLILIGAALLLGAGVNLVHPKRIPWVEDWANHVEAQAVRNGIGLTQLSELLDFLRDGSCLPMDARPADEYARGHIPGAVSVPFESVADGAVIAPEVLKSAKPLVLYCTGPECDDSLLLALHLKELGETELSVFVGGMELWQSELLATEEETVQ